MRLLRLIGAIHRISYVRDNTIIYIITTEAVIFVLGGKILTVQPLKGPSRSIGTVQYVSLA